jgi:uncharacterized protein YecE (DUF72 family)
MKKLLKRGFDVCVYFNNDVGGYAIANARTLSNGMRECATSHLWENMLL